MTCVFTSVIGRNIHHHHARKLSAEDRQNILTVFKEVDSSGQGTLTREDVKVANVCLFGYKPSKFEVDEMMGHEDSGVLKNFMQIDQYVEVMSQKMAARDLDEDIRQTFITFDSQCRGFLTVEDLSKVFAEVAPHMSKHHIEKAFREIDRDGDGRVSYKDFEFMMKYSSDEI